MNGSHGVTNGSSAVEAETHVVKSKSVLLPDFDITAKVSSS